MSEIEDRLDRLESQLERQQETIDDQQATIEAQRERIAELEGDGRDGDDSDSSVLNRRSALKAGGLLALLFGGVGTASADPQGQVGTSSDPLDALYTEELNGGVTNDQSLTDLTGNGLTISSGSLDIESGAVGSAELASDSVTVAGNSVSLGSSTGVDYVDLADTGGSFPIPNGDLANSSMTVSAGTGLGGGGSASLGGSTTLDVASDGIGPTELANAQFREPTTKTLSPGFGSWTEVDPNRPAFLEVEVELAAENTAGGFTDGVVNLSIDESGNYPADVIYDMEFAGGSLASGETDRERRFRSVYIPAGSQFVLTDAFSASGSSNSIKTVRAIVG